MFHFFYLVVEELAGGGLISRLFCGVRGGYVAASFGGRVLFKYHSVIVAVILPATVQVAATVSLVVCHFERGSDGQGGWPKERDVLLNR